MEVNDDLTYEKEPVAIVIIKFISCDRKPFQWSECCGGAIILRSIRGETEAAMRAAYPYLFPQ